MTEREVTGCTDCPFVEKEDWSNDDGDSGVDYNGCALGSPDGVPVWELRNQLGWSRKPPDWCKLRAGDVLVKLVVRKPEPE